jgi:uncharacterized membrane protein
MTVQLGNRNILVIIISLTLLALLSTLFTTGALRILLGLLVFLFFPGYALLSALFPKQAELDGIERAALSLGISIAVVPLLGLALNYTPWGINIYSIFAVTAAFILVNSTIAWYRQSSINVDNRYKPGIRIGLPGYREMSTLDKGLFIVVSIAILLAIGSFVYFNIAPDQGERFSEFYLLSTEGQAVEFPDSVVLGEPVELAVCVVNHEYSDTAYRVVAHINGVEEAIFLTDKLANHQKWQKSVSLTPVVAGEGQKVEFWLYRNNETEPYNKYPLHLYIDVLEESSAD